MEFIDRHLRSRRAETTISSRDIGVDLSDATSESEQDSDDSSDEDEESDSESGTSSEASSDGASLIAGRGIDAISALNLGRSRRQRKAVKRPNNVNMINPAAIPQFDLSAPSDIPVKAESIHPTATSSQIKLSISVLRVRRSLPAPSMSTSAATSYVVLTLALKSLASALPRLLDEELGIFLPILARLAKDISVALFPLNPASTALDGDDRNHEAEDRAHRRSLGKEEARAMIALRQKWSRTGEDSKVKGKGKVREGEGEREWVQQVNDLVKQVRGSFCSDQMFGQLLTVLLYSQNPSPLFLKEASNTLFNTSILNSLESLLLCSTLPRINLSNLDLTNDQLKRCDLLSRSSEVLDWYLTFDRTQKSDGLTTKWSILLLRQVKTVDLSRNRLSSPYRC
jgi:hypothetical protein